MYINEIIRVTYACNWKCKFCNILETNNYWKSNISLNQALINDSKYQKFVNIILQFVCIWIFLTHIFLANIIYLTNLLFKVGSHQEKDNNKLDNSFLWYFMDVILWK